MMTVEPFFSHLNLWVRDIQVGIHTHSHSLHAVTLTDTYIIIILIIDICIYLRQSQSVLSFIGTGVTSMYTLTMSMINPPPPNKLVCNVWWLIMDIDTKYTC